MTTPSEHWPKPYLLQAHAQAVEHGMVWIRPISKADAASLKARLYRVRRRSDASMAAFIPPEYHMVTVGLWSPGNGGQMPLIYNRLPEGQLPPIVPATPEEKGSSLPLPTLNDAPLSQEQIEAATNRLIESADLSMDEGEVESFVSRMMSKVEKEQSS